MCGGGDESTSVTARGGATLVLVVTRPQPQADRWVADLGRRGVAALALPLIRIGALAGRAVLEHSWARLPEYCAVMFVSQAAVQHYFDGHLALPFQAALDGGLRLWATGSGTRQALLRQGVPAQRIDCPGPDSAQFDSEALWPVVAGSLQPGSRVLLVRGENGAALPDADGQYRGSGRDWLSRRLGEAGVLVESLAVYRRCLPSWDDTQRERARQAARGQAVWVFTSGLAIGHLLTLLPAQEWRGQRALATHPRVAAAARAAGFGVVLESRPGLDALLASIESLA